MRTAVALKPTLYQQIASNIETMIDRGLLRPGDRIPSVRQMSRSKKVSVATVLEAYVLLENKGVVEARPQSGFYVREPSGSICEEPSRSRPSKSIRPFTNGEFVISLLQNGRDKKMIQLGCATPATQALPGKTFGRIVSAISRDPNFDVNAYEMPPGNERLRRLIAKRSFAYGCDLPVDEIITTVGGMEAINLALLATTKPGDVVAVESPTYYGALQAMEARGLKILEIPTTPQEGICLDDLEEALDTKKVKVVFSMPTVNNPLGSVMSDARKQQLVQLLAKREIPLIEDDVYSELVFEGSRPKPAKAFDKKGLVILCSSFSKTVSPGARLGWISAGIFTEQVLQLKYMNTVATSTLVQEAMAEFIENEGFERHLRRMRLTYKTQLQQHRVAIERYFPEGTRITKPTGGFLLWVEMPKAVDAFQLYERALEEKISIAPGPIFSPQQNFRNFIRINCGSSFDERVDRAIERLGQLARASR